MVFIFTRPLEAVPSWRSSRPKTKLLRSVASSSSLPTPSSPITTMAPNRSRVGLPGKQRAPNSNSNTLVIHTRAGISRYHDAGLLTVEERMSSMIEKHVSKEVEQQLAAAVNELLDDEEISKLIEERVNEEVEKILAAAPKEQIQDDDITKRVSEHVGKELEPGLADVVSEQNEVMLNKTASSVQGEVELEYVFRFPLFPRYYEDRHNILRILTLCVDR